MKPHIRIIAPIAVAALAIGGGAWWWTNGANATERPGDVRLSGTIEAEQVLVTAEINGRVRQLLVDEGQEVKAGQGLVQLDTALLEAQKAQADAAVAVAEANLDLVKAGAREEELLAAEAQVNQAQSTRDGAAAAYENAKRILANPQELNAQVAQAQAARDQARAQLALVTAGARGEDISVAQAQLAQSQTNLQSTRDRLSLAKTQADTQVNQAGLALQQAQAAYATAKSNWNYVQETGKNPVQPETVNAQGKKVPNKVTDAQREQYYAALVQTEAAMHQAEQAVAQAQANAETARQAEITGIQGAEQQVTASQASVDKLQSGATKEQIQAAQVALASAQRTLSVAVATRDNPQQLQMAADNAKSQLDTADARLAEAQARYQSLQSGARREQIAAAEAQVAQARASTQQIAVQLSKATLAAPRAGIVLSRPIHEGEQATPGTALLTIGTLDTVRLTVYVAETDLGQVRQGQKVNVSVDSFPDRTFTGTITFIGQQAEFTPRNVQTQAERVTTVFPVRVELPNQDHALKPGMPADAMIAGAK